MTIRRLRKGFSCGATLLAVGANACGSDSANGPEPADAAIEMPPPGNHALHFDGISDFATTGTASFPTGNITQTLEMWVRYPSAMHTQDFLVLRKDYRSGIKVGLRNGTVAVWTVYASQTLVAAQTLPVVNKWHHVAYVFDPNAPGPSNLLYIDGQLAASSDATPNSLTPLDSWIGTVDGTSEFFGGDLDAIRVWRVARSAASVRQDMLGLTAPEALGTAAYFDCDAIMGTQVIDNSGNGNTMTLGEGEPNRMPTTIPSTVSESM